MTSADPTPGTPASPLAVIVLAAGKGTRMRSDLPKVMHKLADRTMLRHVLQAAESLNPAQIIVVAGPDMPSVAAEAAPHALAIQQEQLGTAHAVAAARTVLAPGIGDVLVVYGDTPLITPETLRAMIGERRRHRAAVVVLGMRVAPPNAYGRLVLDQQANLVAIVEAAEASSEQLAINLCNSGVMAIDGASLFDLIDGVRADNAKGEYYLTDIVALATAQGRTARVVEAPAEELAGVNSRADQAAAEAILQHRLRLAAMAGGATLTDPDSVFLSADTILGRDVIVGPHVVFGPGVKVADRVTIHAFSHLCGATVGQGAVIGPFARLRPGTTVGSDAHVGNFVELKNTVLGEGAKANHLSYLGDAVIGARSNIGAGTITCNYDGFFKHKTVIEADVFIGSNSALVAPLTIGAGAMVAAGSTITRSVAPDATAVGRAGQRDLAGHAGAFRARKQAEKTAPPAKPPE